MTPHPPPEESVRYTVGHVLAQRFRIVRFIGHGGMGDVYEAADLVLHQHVALKLIRPEVRFEPHMLALLRDEVRKARSVGHPNVCRVFNLERDDTDGVTFVTMELLAGETLHAKLKRGERFTTSSALPVLRQIAAGMDAVHECRILHLDLKPGNVMLGSRTGHIPRAVVTDFGIAQSDTPPDSNDSTISIIERKGGTRGYMAPERLVAGARLSPAADVYSFGLIAFEMLAGKMSSSPPRSVREVPPAWESMIRRCTAFEPTDRFPTCGAAIAELDVSSASDMSARHWARVNRRGVLLVVAVVALIVATFVFPSRSAIPVSAQRWYVKGVDAIREGTYYKSVLALGQAVKESQSFGMAHASLAEAWTELDSPERANEEMLLAGGPAGLTSRDRRRFDAIHLTVTRDFAGALEIYQDLARTSSPNARAGALVDFGRALERAGKSARAMEQYVAATGLDSNYAGAYLRLATVAGKLQQADRVPQALDRALALYQAASNLDGATEVFYQRGHFANARGHLDEAQEWLEQARQSAQVTHNPHQLIRALLQLSAIAYQRVDHAASRKFAEEAIREARANNIEFLAGRGFLDLGNSFLTVGDPERATEYFNEALRISRNNHAGQLEAMALYSLGSIGIRDHKDEAGALQMEQALKWFQQNGYSDYSSKCLLFLGQFRRDRGDLPAAAVAFQEQLDLARASNNDLQRSLALSFIASVLLRQERFPDALESARESLAVSQSLGDSLRAGWADARLANIYLNLGRFDESIQAARDAEVIAAKGKIADLSADAIVNRAKAAFVRGSAAEAAAIADSAIAAYQKKYPQLVGELFGLLALARRSAPAHSRLEWCARGLELLRGDFGQGLNARLSEAQVRLETGDAKGALKICDEIRPGFQRQESDYSLFRTDLITAIAQSRSGLDAKAALEASAEDLDRCRKRFDEAAWQKFEMRADFREWEKIFRKLRSKRV